MKKIISVIILLCTFQVNAQILTLYISGDTLYARNPSTGERIQLTKTATFQSIVNLLGYTPVNPTAISNIDNTSDANKPISTAEQTALNLKANLSGPSFSGAVTTTGSMGYATGTGGTVTQITSKSTGVTLNKITGRITMANSALAAGAIVSFTLTNSTISPNDLLILNHAGTGTVGAYLINGQSGAGTAVINIRNTSAGALSEAIVISFIIIKSVNN